MYRRDEFYSVVTAVLVCSLEQKAISAWWNLHLVLYFSNSYHCSYRQYNIPYKTGEGQLSYEFVILIELIFKEPNVLTSFADIW